MKIKQPVLICVLAWSALAVSESARAQTPPDVAPPPSASSGCAPTQTAPDQGSISSGNGSAQSNGTAQGREPLSDKLAQSGGVLCPPTGVDPEIRAPTPQTGSDMPVIPPPGSPGGDPTIRPK
jgi:hypothetical protein